MRSPRRGSHPAGESDKRDVQDILEYYDVWYTDAKRVDNVPSIQSSTVAGNPTGGTAGGNTPSSSLIKSDPTRSTGSSSSALSGHQRQDDPSPARVTEPGPSASAELTTTAYATSATGGTPTELPNTGDQDRHEVMTGSTSSEVQLLSTVSDDHRTTSLLQTSTSSVVHNTWITATLDEALPSGVTMIPFITFLAKNRTSPSIDSTNMATHSLSSNNIVSSTSAIYPTTSSSTIAISSAVPRIAQAEGVTSTEKARTIAGVTAGIVVVVLLLIICSIAYMRGLGRTRRFRPFHAPHKEPPVNQSYENFFPPQGSGKRGVSLDLENAVITSGSGPADDKDEWEDIDMRRGNMERDTEQGQESWCREGERTKTTRRPPFSPWEEVRRRIYAQG